MVRIIMPLTTLLAMLFFGVIREPVPVPEPMEPDPAYTQVILGRAQKIVNALGIDDETRAVQVRDLIADQYRSLSTLHDTRDAQIEAVKSRAGDNKEGADLVVKALEDMAQALQDRLHTRYLLKLSALLTPVQVDQVKDGMTYGVVQVTYKSYLDMLPQLTDEQKATVMAYLVEAREIAMDAGSSKKKHWWFGKYKGRINNYLSAQGYDLKKASEERNARARGESSR